MKCNPNFLFFVLLIMLNFELCFANSKTCKLIKPLPPKNYNKYNIADFKKLNSPDLKNYMQQYKRLNGHDLSKNLFRSEIFNQGFFIDKRGTFISAIHVGRVEELVVGGKIKAGEEYLAGVNGPALESDEIQILYIGKGSQAFIENFDKPYLYGCFDCLPLNQLGDIVIGRVKDISLYKNKIMPVLLAENLPDFKSELLALGKPQEVTTIPQGEVRGSIGNFKGSWGSSIVTSNKVIRGFSGGPLLDSNGRAIGVIVSILNHVDFVANQWPELSLLRPSCWDENWTIAFNLISIKDKVKAAMNYPSTVPQ